MFENGIILEFYSKKGDLVSIMYNYTKERSLIVNYTTSDVVILKDSKDMVNSILEKVSEDIKSITYVEDNQKDAFIGELDYWLRSDYKVDLAKSLVNLLIEM